MFIYQGFENKLLSWYTLLVVNQQIYFTKLYEIRRFYGIGDFIQKGDEVSENGCSQIL